MKINILLGVLALAVSHTLGLLEESQVKPRKRCSSKPPNNKDNNWLLKNGQVLDTINQSFSTKDVLILDGLIHSIGNNLTLPNLDDRLDIPELDLRGLLVTPGLIDMHTHVYYGSTYWGLNIDTIAALTGVTTIVDAGSSGAFNYLGLKNYIIEKSQIDIFTFLNIAGQGLTARTGELRDPDRMIDVISTKEMIELHKDNIKGIKVRMDKDTTGDSGIKGLEIARKIADELNVKLMIHVGHTPPTLEIMEPLMKPGDILTHCFNSHGNKLLNQNNTKFIPAYHKLHNKGIIFDVGHGGGSFDYKVAESMLAMGFEPTTISSDLHQVSILGHAKSLPFVLSKFINLGMPLETVLTKATLAPAKIIGLDLSKYGQIAPGFMADLAIFELRNGSFKFGDSANNERIGDRLLVPKLTLKRGRKLKSLEELAPLPWAVRDAGLVSGNKP